MILIFESSLLLAELSNVCHFHEIEKYGNDQYQLTYPIHGLINKSIIVTRCQNIYDFHS